MSRKHKKVYKSEIELREEALINKYYETEDGVVQIDMHYEYASDLTDERNITHVPAFKFDEIQEINEIIGELPEDRKFDINFLVDEVDVEPKKIVDALHDTLELNYYKKYHKNKSKWVLASSLLIIGITLLIIFGFTDFYNALGESAGASIVKEFMEITAWVFIWQGVTAAFLERLDLDIDSTRFRKKLRHVDFYDKNDKLIYHEDAAERFKYWKTERGQVNFYKILLLLSGTAIIVLGVYSFLDSIVTLIREHSILYFSADLVQFLFSTLGGIGALSIYYGKKRFVIATLVVAIFNLFIIVLFGIISVLTGGSIMTISNWITIIVYIIFIFGFFMYLATQKKQIRKYVIEEVIEDKQLVRAKIDEIKERQMKKREASTTSKPKESEEIK